MSSKKYGRARYSAYRLMGIVQIVATGETPNINDEPSLEQLPFLIYPPIYGFFVTTADVSLPALKPFTVQIQTHYPGDAAFVRIHDADGDHAIAIAEVVPPIKAMEVNGAADVDAAEFCVYQWIGIHPYLIARCDAILPAVYTRVFGPATRKACEDYIAEHGGK